MTLCGTLRLALCLSLPLFGCSSGKSERTAEPASTLTGTVSYRERMALPEDAVIEVTLSDVSRQDVAAEHVALATIPAAGRQVPIPFELRYDSARIQPNHTYAVRATIRSGERLLFTTDTHTPVITRGHPTRVELALVQVQEPTAPR
jgi:putative lipoprotein